MKCIDCPSFLERTFFPHTQGSSGRCHNPNSPKYGQWMVGAWGCTPKKYVEKDLFNNI